MLSLRVWPNHGKRQDVNSSYLYLFATRPCRAHTHYPTSTLIILAHLKFGASDAYVTTRHRSGTAVLFTPFIPPLSPTLGA